MRASEQIQSFFDWYHRKLKEAEDGVSGKGGQSLYITSGAAAFDDEYEDIDQAMQVWETDMLTDRCDSCDRPIEEGSKKGLCFYCHLELEEGRRWQCGLCGWEGRQSHTKEVCRLMRSIDAHFNLSNRLIYGLIESLTSFLDESRKILETSRQV